MKAHLLVFDTESVTLKHVIKVIDELSEIENWHVVFENTICVVSESGAKALAEHLNDRLPDVRYLISEVQAEKKGGRMQRSILALLNSPGPVEREPA